MCRKQTCKEVMSPAVPGWGIEPGEGKGLLHTDKDGKNIIREYISSEKGNYVAFYNELYEALRNGKPLPVTAEEGLKVIRIIEACFTKCLRKTGCGIIKFY